MKVALLAGGLGSRLAEETGAIPKPMIEIGGIPILWHIMRHYACFGHSDFVVALGYKGNYIRHYATDFAALSPGNLRIDYSRRQVEYDTALGNERGSWSMDGWTLHLRRYRPRHQYRRAHQAAGPAIGDERFMLTWGDGVSTVDLDALLAFHRSHGRLVTLTAVRPPARFGHLELDGDRISGVRREAAGRRGLDQRRLLRAASRASSTTSKATTRSSSGEPLRAPGRATASSWPTATTASGSAWTRSATASCWRSSGPAATRPGSIWDRQRPMAANDERSVACVS